MRWCKHSGYDRASLVVLTLFMFAARGQAIETPPKNVLQEARRLYLDGIGKYRENEWAEAAESLRASAQLYPLPLTLFNIGLCERALGHYVRARQAFEVATERLRASPRALTAAEARELLEYMRENDRVIAYAELTVSPAQVTLSIDGRPLETIPAADGERPLFLAGTLPPGSGSPVPRQQFVVRLDPGMHVLQIVGDGLRTYAASESFAPGERRAIVMRTDRLPITLSVNSDRPGAVATISGGNVGTVAHAVPFMIEDEPGRYTIEVEKRGFVRYHGSLELKPGDKPVLLAKLPVYKPPIYKRWWFWTAAAGAVGAAVGFSVGLSLGPPPYDGGSSGWVAHTPTATASLPTTPRWGRR